MDHARVILKGDEMAVFSKKVRDFAKKRIEESPLANAHPTPGDVAKNLAVGLDYYKQMGWIHESANPDEITVTIRKDGSGFDLSCKVRLSGVAEFVENSVEVPPEVVESMQREADDRGITMEVLLAEMEDEINADMEGENDES